MRRRRLVVRGDDGALTWSPPLTRANCHLTGPARRHNRQSKYNLAPGHSCLGTSALLASQHRHSRIRRLQAVPKDRSVRCAAPQLSAIVLQLQMPVALLVVGGVHQAA